MLELADRNRVFEQINLCFFDLSVGAHPGLPDSTHGGPFYESSEAFRLQSDAPSGVVHIGLIVL